MNFDELLILFEGLADRQADGVESVVPLGDAVFKVMISTTPGRTHTVWLRQVEDAGASMVHLVAPAAPVPKGKEIGGDVARELLRKNGVQPNAAWGLVQMGDVEHLALIRGLSLEALDPATAVLYVVGLANGADAFEEQMGGDAL